MGHIARDGAEILVELVETPIYWESKYAGIHINKDHQMYHH